MNARLWTVVTLTVCMSATMAAGNEREQVRARQPAVMVASHRITLLGDWVAAVGRHVPGQLDEAGMSVLAWSPEDLRAVWLDVQALIVVVDRPSATRFTSQPSGQTFDFSGSPGLATLRELAGAVRTGAGGSDAFYKRAATLHADIAMNAHAASGSSASGSLMVHTKDGAQVSVRGNVVHWEFGRLLLDALRQPSADDFVRSWYRATMAFKLRIGDLDTPHFDRGAALWPRDAWVLFFLGCLHEWFADPRVQAATGSVRLPRGVTLAVKSEGSELGAAQESLRRALEADPDHVEARVHHGRVLGRLARHQLAAVALRLAAARAREPLVAYYAQLFLGAEEEALGRLSEAGAAYSSAAALYPHAQAPRLALSQLRHRAGDRAAARQALTPVLQGRAAIDEPWWDYRRASGRHSDDLIAVVYDLLKAGDTR